MFHPHPFLKELLLFCPICIKEAVKLEHLLHYEKTGRVKILIIVSLSVKLIQHDGIISSSTCQQQH